MSKHTQGPWTVLPREAGIPYVRVRGTRPGGRYKVANILEPIYDGPDTANGSETNANASLIAAAPELLEALEAMDRYAFGLIEHVATGSSTGEIKDYIIARRGIAAAARAAIAKARGEA